MRTSSLLKAFCVVPMGTPVVGSAKKSVRVFVSSTFLVNAVLKTPARFTCSTGENMTPRFEFQPCR